MCWADCWNWGECRSPLGYGWIYIPGVGRRGAHRFVYESLIGDVPSGLELDHLCRNPNCVNPEHLEAVTHAENMRRGYWATLHNSCPQGHELTLENTYLHGGVRRCLTCHRARSREGMRALAQRRRAERETKEAAA